MRPQVAHQHNRWHSPVCCSNLKATVLCYNQYTPHLAAGGVVLEGAALVVHVDHASARMLLFFLKRGLSEKECDGGDSAVSVRRPWCWAITY